MTEKPGAESGWQRTNSAAHVLGGMPHFKHFVSIDSRLVKPCEE